MPSSRRYNEPPVNRLGEQLIELGIATPQQVQKALEIQRREGSARRRFGEILCTDLGCNRDAVFRTIARIYGFHEVELTLIPRDELISFVIEFFERSPEKIKQEFLIHHILPYRFHHQSPDFITFITEDVTDPTLNLLLFQLKLTKYDLAYASLQEIDLVINSLEKPQNEFLALLEEINNENAAIETIEEQEDLELEIDTNSSILINLVEGCFIEAVRKNASDIHILPRTANRTDFLFRVDGKLKLWHSQEGYKPETISAVVKDRTRNVDRFVWDASQDGFIQRQIDSTVIRFRVSIMPIVAQDFKRKFESIVIRILDDRKVITDLSKLGFHKQAEIAFLKSIRRPQGMVILTGPTGSGKSTTLLAALYQVLTPDKNVLTIEDPVEYMIRDARQIRLSHTLDFEGAIRGILRHDPDIVMVGEMRDKTTAEIAIKLANTGHLTFSTLHTNDAPSAVSRLYKMGVEPFLIATAMNIVVAQRLLRTLCNECKRPSKLFDKEAAKLLGFADEEIDSIVFYEAVGCEKCNHGYKGRAAIHEALFFSKTIRKFIVDSKTDINEDSLRELAEKEGMLTLRSSGRDRIKLGHTTIEEVVATTTED